MTKEQDSSSDRVSFGWPGNRIAQQAQSLHDWTRDKSAQSSARPLPVLLDGLSDSLRDARKNADSLILNAQNSSSIRRIKSGIDEFSNQAKTIMQSTLQPSQSSRGLEDWALLGRVGSIREERPRSSMRKSASAMDFKQLAGKRSRRKGKGTGPPTSSSEWDLMSALNTLTVANSTPARTFLPQVAQLPALREQARSYLFFLKGKLCNVHVNIFWLALFKQIAKIHLSLARIILCCRVCQNLFVILLADVNIILEDENSACGYRSTCCFLDVKFLGGLCRRSS